MGDRSRNEGIQVLARAFGTDQSQAPDPSYSTRSNLLGAAPPNPHLCKWVRCVLYIVCCALCVLLVCCALCVVHCVLCVVHCALCIVCCALCVMSCVLCLMYCIVCCVLCVISLVSCIFYHYLVYKQGH